MPSSSAGSAGNSGPKSTGEEREELTQKLGLQIIQIITRNNALHPSSNHPDNVVLIRLMRTLLLDLERDGASSSVITQFFVEEQPIYERPADLDTGPLVASSSGEATTSATSEVNQYNFRLVGTSSSTPQVSTQSGSSQGSSEGEEGQGFQQVQQSSTCQSQVQWTHQSQPETTQQQQQLNPCRSQNAQHDQRNPQSEEENQNTQNLGQAPQDEQQQQDQQQTQQGLGAGLGANDLLAQIGHLLGRNAQQDGNMNSGGMQDDQGRQGSSGPNHSWQAPSRKDQQQSQQEDPQDMSDAEPPTHQDQQPPAPQQALISSQPQQQQQQIGASTQAAPSGRNNMNMILLMALLANMNSEQQQQLAQQLIQMQQNRPPQQQAAPPQQQQQQQPPTNQIAQPQQPQQPQQNFGTLISLLQNAFGGQGNNSAPAPTSNTATATATNNNGPPPVAQAPDQPPPQPAQQQPQQHQPPRHAIREVNIPNGYPMRDIEYPGVHDVVLGRGRGASSHIGNVNFRGFIKQWKPKYAAANRVDKPKVAGEVVGKWRQKSPPGRFLVQVRTSTRNLWNDIGDHKARQKTSQSLRERECVRKPRRRKKRGDGGSEEVVSSEPMDDSSSVASDNSDIDDEEESNMEESAKMPAAAGNVGPSAGSSTSAPRPVSGDSGESSSTSGDSSKSKSKEQSEGSDTS